MIVVGKSAYIIQKTSKRNSHCSVTDLGTGVVIYTEILEEGESRKTHCSIMQAEINAIE